MRDVTEILNWRRLDEKITLSGQPSKDQLAMIRDLGVTHVINLGLGHGEGALEDEPQVVAALGMEYIHIPVDFENPTDADFEAFSKAMDALKGAPIHVHCIYNARVTAFIYRYSKTGQTISEADAYALMDGIWRPGDDWADFIGRKESVGQPNTYAGEDY